MCGAEDKEIELILSELQEIKSVLIGSFTERGLISKIANLEKVINIIGTLSITTVAAVIARAVYIMSTLG